MRPKRSAHAAMAGLLAVLAPAVVLAEGTDCDNPTKIVADGRLVESFHSTLATYWFAIYAHAGSSYSVEVRSTRAPGQPNTTLTVFAPGDVGPAPTCAGASSLTVTETTAKEPDVRDAGGRWSFIATATGYHLVRADGGTGVDYSFAARETTMFSAAWSTNGTYQTYYSFFNTTHSTITGTLTLTRTDGTAAGSTAMTILGRTTQATNTVALATPRNFTGTATFVHDGPPAAVLVEASVANFSLTPPYIQPVKFEAVRETP